MTQSPVDTLIFLGIPSHDGRIDVGTANCILKSARLSRCAVQFNVASLLAHNFNTLYCNAINLMKTGLAITHFCLLHSDIVPVEDNWMSILLDEMKKHELAVISAVIPIKDGRGLTSTAMCMSDDSLNVKNLTRRLTLIETMALPVTFRQEDLSSLKGLSGSPGTLLINTGLMLIDLRHPQAPHLFFTIKDDITLAGATNGDLDGAPDRLVARCEPEDWGFSRLLSSLNVPYAATRLVGVRHIGRFEYDSRIAWGSKQDPVHFPVEDAVPASAAAE